MEIVDRKERGQNNLILLTGKYKDLLGNNSLYTALWQAQYKGHFPQPSGAEEGMDSGVPC